MPLPHLLSGLAISLLLTLLQPLQPHLLFERQAIMAGEWWRILSGNFVHTNTAHLLLNLGGLWLLLLLCHTVLGVRQLAASIPAIGIGIGLGLWFGQPGLQWYVGFSGILYGLYLLGGIRLAMAGDPLTGIALVGLIGIKTGLDVYNGNSMLSQSLIGAPVIFPAHIYGMLAALLIALPGLFANWKTKQP